MARRIIQQSEILGFQRQAEVWNFDFPEEKYPCLEDRQETYEQRITWGKSRCKDSILGIVGCARNIEEQIYRTIHQWELIGKLFKDYRVFVYESDSTDQTPHILKEWQNNNPRIFYKSEKLELPRLNDLSEKRFEIMAKVRNKYVDFASEHFSDYDYIMVADMDLRGGISINGVLNSFGYAPWWNVITSNGLDISGFGFYDLACYFGKNFDEESYLIEQREGAEFANMKKGAVRPSFKRGEIPVKIAAGFGGLAFYRREVFVQSCYSAELCDHASFLKTLAEKGYSRVFLNPSMIVVR